MNKLLLTLAAVLVGCSDSTPTGHELMSQLQLNQQKYEALVVNIEQCNGFNSHNTDSFEQYCYDVADELGLLNITGHQEEEGTFNVELTTHTVSHSMIFSYSDFGFALDSTLGEEAGNKTVVELHRFNEVAQQGCGQGLGANHYQFDSGLRFRGQPWLLFIDRLCD